MFSGCHNSAVRCFQVVTIMQSDVFRLSQFCCQMFSGCQIMQSDVFRLFTFCSHVLGCHNSYSGWYNSADRHFVGWHSSGLSWYHPTIMFRQSQFWCNVLGCHNSRIMFWVLQFCCQTFCRLTVLASVDTIMQSCLSSHNSGVMFQVENYALSC